MFCDGEGGGEKVGRRVQLGDVVSPSVKELSGESREEEATLFRRLSKNSGEKC